MPIPRNSGRKSPIIKQGANPSTMNNVHFPFTKLIGLCAALLLIAPFTSAGNPLPETKPTPAPELTSLTPGIYHPNNPALIFSGSDWTVNENKAETEIENAIVLFQVALKESGVVIVEYHAAPGAGQFQVQIDKNPMVGPISQSIGQADSLQYWVSPTLKAGTHRIFLSSLDNGPVNFARIGIGPLVKARDAVFDNTDPGAIIFGTWTTENYPLASNGGKAVTSGPESGPIFMVFEQKFPGSVNVNLVSTDQKGLAHVVLDGLPTNFPYQTPGKPIAVSIIVGKTEPGRHILMITGDGTDNVVRFDGFKISEKVPMNLPTVDPKTDPDSPEYVPVIKVDHPLPFLSDGKFHACFVDRNGGVKCRGYNASGQLGRGAAAASLNILSLGPVLGLDSGVLTVAAGGSHTCALMNNGSIKCWGSGQFGQLGNGASKAAQDDPVDVVELGDKAVDVAAGEYHTCALLSNGKVQCWGLNGAGQLGNGVDQEYLGRNVPGDVIGLPSAATMITAGPSHTCAVVMDGSMWCWGNDEYGQLGDGSVVKGAADKGKATPVKVAGLENVTLMAAGERHTCAMADKVVYCWGDNSRGQLGNGTTESSAVPQAVTSLNPNVTVLTAGEKHTCALVADPSEPGKSIQCWGDNAYGQMGRSFDSKIGSTPVAVEGATGETTLLSAGYEFTCAVSKDDQAFCWGITSYGQSGNLTDSSPAMLPELTPTPGLVEGPAESTLEVVQPVDLAAPVIGPTPVKIAP
jgi:alpha-tubulin suppressor-like RCC1 family protein